MTLDKITCIDGGSAQYWQDRRLGFALIRQAERAAKEMAEAPQYISGGYDADGDQIAIENLGPHDAFEEAIRALEQNATAVSILAAQGRHEIHYTVIWPVYLQLHPVLKDIFLDSPPGEVGQ